jgi:hypothetical protein
LRSDNTVYEAYAVKADDIAQVWKAESRITREFEKSSGENVRMSSLEQRLLDLERKLSNS